MTVAEVPFRSDLQRGAPAQLTLFDVVFAPVGLYCVGYIAFRSFDTAAFMLVLAASTAIVLWRRSVAVHSLYFWFLAYSLVVLVISLTLGMPKSWTMYFDDIAALRHWIWIYSLPVFSTVFYMACRRYFPIFLSRPLLIIVTVYSIITAIRYFNSAFLTEYKGITLYTIANDNAVIFVMFVSYLFFGRSPYFVKLLVVLAMTLLSSSSQSILATFVVAVMWFTGRPRTVFVALLSLLFVGQILAPFYANEIHQMDANFGIRALFWRDAATTVVDTFGSGVGFGTEYIRNSFVELKGTSWTIVPEDGDGRLFVGTHSTFYDVLLRTGIVGFVLFSLWLVTQASRGWQLSGSPSGAYWSVAAIFLIVNTVNMGVTSVTFLLGSCLFLGYMTFVASMPSQNVDASPDAKMATEL